jgi:integrase
MPLWVFPSREGTAVEERNIRHVFARILAKAELRTIRIDDLRHTTATLLLQTGAPITYVSQQLGHRDASITLRVYAHWLPDASRRGSIGHAGATKRIPCSSGDGFRECCGSG